MSIHDKDLAMNAHERGRPSGAAYLLALPPIILLFIFKVIPFINGIILAFKEYDLEKGIRGTSWVGLRNFQELFSSFFFPKILGNTIILKIEYIILCSAFAFILTLILGFIRTRFWQRFFSTIFLLPYFIPTVVFSYLALYTMSHAGIFFMFSIESLMAPESFRLIYVILEVIKNIGIPVIMALGAINAKRDLDDGTGSFLHIQLLPMLKAIGLFALIQLSALLTMDYELLSNFQNPMVYEVADTIDTYAFRMGLISGDFGVAGAAWLFKYLIQLVFAILMFMLIKKYFVKGAFAKGATYGNRTKKRRSLAAIVAGLFIVEVYLLLTMAPLAVSVVEVFKDGGGASNDFMAGLPFYSSFATYLFAIAFAVVINAIFTVLLAYPLTVKGLPGGGVYAIFLIIVLNMGMGGIHEYLFFKDIGMVNTIWPYLITGFFTLVNVFVLKAIYNTRYTSIDERAAKGIEGDIASFFRRFLPKVVKPILGLSAIQYAFMWNSCYPGQLVYMAEPSKFSPVMMFQNIMTGLQPDAYGSLTLEVIKLAAIISIPGIIILLILMIFGGHEIFIGQARKS